MWQWSGKVGNARPHPMEAWPGQWQRSAILRQQRQAYLACPGPVQETSDQSTAWVHGCLFIIHVTLNPHSSCTCTNFTKLRKNFLNLWCNTVIPHCILFLVMRLFCSNLSSFLPVNIDYDNNNRLYALSIQHLTSLSSNDVENNEIFKYEIEG